MYDDELKKIATTEDADERLKLAGELAGSLTGAIDVNELNALNKQIDDLKSQVDNANKERDNIKQKYIDAFFSGALKQPAQKEPEPKQEVAKVVTLDSILNATPKAEKE